MALGIAVSACKGKKTGPENSVYIEKMEATSTEFGGLKYHVANIFGNGSWRSLPMKNASEGVQLYFLNETSLQGSTVQLGTNKIASMVVKCNKASYNIYLNGARNGSANCGDKLATQRFGTISTLFIQARLEGEDSYFEIESVQFFSEGGDEYSVVYPEPLNGKVEASSVLTPKEAYQPYYVFDGRTGFGWVEGKSDAGEGESLSISFESETTIDGLEVYTGYQRSRSHFDKNAAVTKLGVSIDGKEEFTVELKPQMGAQRVKFPSAVTGKILSLTIRGVRKGTMWQDTVISEITLLNGTGRYTLLDPAFEESTRQTLEKIKGTFLARVVGNQLNYMSIPDAVYSTESVLFRPNGSFVVRFAEYDDIEGSESERILDGNWMIKSSGADQAVLEIFGRDKQIAAFTQYEGDPYSPGWGERKTSTEEVIFSEKNLTLTKGTAIIESPEDQTEAPGVEIKSGRVNRIFPL